MRIPPHADRNIGFDLRQSRWAQTNPRILAQLGIDPRRDDSASLERSLDADPRRYLRLRFLAYDEFTGSRTYFESGRCYSDKIIRGKFKEMSVDPCTDVDDAGAP